MGTRVWLCILAVAAALGAVGCGDDDDGGGEAAGGGGTPEGPVAVSSWGGSWTEAEQEHIGDPFTQETGIEVEYKVTGESPTSPALLQAQSGNVQLDVINSENAELLRSTSLPTGSPTAAYLRVETPASIRSITARVSGSRSAKDS